MIKEMQERMNSGLQTRDLAEVLEDESTIVFIQTLRSSGYEFKEIDATMRLEPGLSKSKRRLYVGDNTAGALGLGALCMYAYTWPYPGGYFQAASLVLLTTFYWRLFAVQFLSPTYRELLGSLCWYVLLPAQLAWCGFVVSHAPGFLANADSHAPTRHIVYKVLWSHAPHFCHIVYKVGVRVMELGWLQGLLAVPTEEEVARMSLAVSWWWVAAPFVPFLLLLVYQCGTLTNRGPR
jgi:hypothetical protein